MGKVILVGVLGGIIFALVLNAINGSNQTNPIHIGENVKQTPKEAKDDAIMRISAGEMQIKGMLKDSSSAEFRHVFVSAKGIVCGEVNSKNSFGAYGGYQPFIAIPGYGVMRESTTAKDFRGAWKTACLGKPRLSMP